MLKIADAILKIISSKRYSQVLKVFYNKISKAEMKKGT